MSDVDNHPKLVWLDLEMTGLDPDSERIIEIATIVTDKDLNVLQEGPVIAIKTDKNIIDSNAEHGNNPLARNYILNTLAKLKTKELPGTP